MQKKKSNWTGKIIVIFISVVFVSSIFAMTQFSPGGKQSKPVAFQVSGYTFYSQDGAYVTEIDAGSRKYQVSFLSNPQKAKDISINSKAATLLSAADEVFISYNPNELVADYPNLAGQEIGNMLVNFYNIQTNIAFTKDQTPPNPDVPLRSCKDADASTGIVELRLGDRTEVTVEGDCVVVEGKDELALLEASSALAMKLAGLDL